MRALLGLLLTSLLAAWLGQGPGPVLVASPPLPSPSDTPPLPLPAPAEWAVDPAWSEAEQAAARGDRLLARGLELMASDGSQLLTLPGGLPSRSPTEALRRALEEYRRWQALHDPSDPQPAWSAVFGAELCRRHLDLPPDPTLSEKDSLAAEYWGERPGEAMGSIWHARLQRPIPTGQARHKLEIYRQLGGGLFREQRAQGVIRNLVRLVGDLEGRRIGDWGCGTGMLGAGLAEEVGPGGAYVGADLAAPVLEFARFAAARDPRIQALVAQGLELRFVLSSPERSGFEPSSLDLIYTNIHLGAEGRDPGPEEVRRLPALRSLRAALKSGGVLVVEESHVPLQTAVRLLCSPEVGFRPPRAFDHACQPLSEDPARSTRTAWFGLFAR